MNPKFVSTLKYILGIGAGIGLFYFAFRDMSMEKMMSYFASARWEWLIFSMCFSVLSHLIRAERWRMQLKASGHPTTAPVTFSAIMFMYLVNLAFPRAGEVARCTALYQTEKIPVATSLGTAVTERLMDVIMLGIFLLITFFLASPLILGFIETASAGKEGGGLPIWLYVVAAVGIVGLIVAFLLRNKLLEIPIVKKAYSFAMNLVESALSIRKLENPALFIFYSFAIWFCYWMMMYVGLYCFEPIAAQGEGQSLLRFAFIGTVIGSLGMVLPIPGGIGPYHQAIIFTFVALHLFPEDETGRAMGQTFAFAFHTAQMLVMIIGGALGYLYLMLRKKPESVA
jgi:glycosyltransferase 2 family protein